MTEINLKQSDPMLWARGAATGGLPSAALAGPAAIVGLGRMGLSFRTPEAGKSAAHVYQVGRADELDALAQRAEELHHAQLDGGGAHGSAFDAAFETAELCHAALRIGAVGAPLTAAQAVHDCRVGALFLRAAQEAARAELERRSLAGECSADESCEAGELCSIAAGFSSSAEGLLQEIETALGAHCEGSK